MSLTRLIWRGELLRPGEWELPPDVARHARVARVADGDRLELLDLEGGVAVARLLRWRGSSCVVEVEEMLQGRGEPPGALLLGLGVLHTQAFDWAVEKATELGATVIVPVLTDRVQGRRHESRVTRWQRVSEAAVAQCGRSRAAVVEPPEPLAAFVRRPAGLRLLADPGGPRPAPRSVGESGLAVLVGPEGGLTGDEVALSLAAGYESLGLGPRTLRAETAAVAALTLAQRLAGWL
jgi:16S rRNA (uracil1498-N3)-methyltransferase